MKLGKTLITEEKLQKRIQEIADEINKEYAGESILAVIVLKGGVFFGTELVKRITVPCKIDFIQASSYGDGTVSTKNVVIKKDIDVSVENENVIFMEDIIDTGYTMKGVIDIFKDRKAKSVKLAALLSKPSRREVEINIDYLGMEIPNEFAVGYGLDYAQLYRNLPYVAAMEEE